MSSLYQPTRNSLKTHYTPQWFRDAKFGIYTHTWYPFYMYREGELQYEYHVKTYRHPSEFGYKDFIPIFTAEKFDPDEWAELFQRSGAQFAGPVAEHRDGFCMWDTQYSEWSAAKMGPRRDVVGELEQAIRKQGMRFMVALHHAANWWFFPHWRSEFDVSDPRYAGLYGELHNLDKDPGEGIEGFESFFAQDKPSKAFLEQWKGKTLEVIDEYQPDMVWFDFGLVGMQENYRSVKTLVHYLVDNISKSGHLLLNVGPKPNGEIPEQAQALLVGLGDWLAVNGEAIFGTTAWMTYGEGPTQMTKAGYFIKDQEVEYTAQDIRFTVTDDALYAICLGWPQERAVIETLKYASEAEIKSVRMLGADAQLEWSLTPEGQSVAMPREKPCEHPFVPKIMRGSPFEG